MHIMKTNVATTGLEDGELPKCYNHIYEEQIRADMEHLAQQRLYGQIKQDNFKEYRTCQSLHLINDLK